MVTARHFVKSKTPTFGGGSPPPPPSSTRHATPLGIPRQPVPGQPERKVTPPPFKAQTPPPVKVPTPPPFNAQPAPRQPLDSMRFDSEPPTKQKNQTASIYQSLLSVFDEMTDDQRMEFVDLASVYASLTAGARKDLVDMLGEYAKLGPEERKAVFEAVQNLQAARSRR
jgi:hypothetical protein